MKPKLIIKADTHKYRNMAGAMAHSWLATWVVGKTERSVHCSVVFDLEETNRAIANYIFLPGPPVKRHYDIHTCFAGFLGENLRPDLDFKSIIFEYRQVSS